MLSLKAGDFGVGKRGVVAVREPWLLRQQGSRWTIYIMSLLLWFELWHISDGRLPGQQLAAKGPPRLFPGGSDFYRLLPFRLAECPRGSPPWQRTSRRNARASAEMDGRFLKRWRRGGDLAQIRPRVYCRLRSNLLIKLVPQEGFRTPDPIITNDVLYQLSYCGPFE